jgi:DNA-binding MarR family transcriptional regulator
MEDIRSVLSQFHSKKKKSSDLQKSVTDPFARPSNSEIPDLFFDEVLQRFKLNRPEIMLLMFLYRQTWSRPNLYKSHGIGPLNSYTELSHQIGLTMEELTQYLRTLENYGFIQTVRAGQYFVRKYFTEELDQKFGQDYDEFF